MELSREPTKSDILYCIYHAENLIDVNIGQPFSLCCTYPNSLMNCATYTLLNNKDITTDIHLLCLWIKYKNCQSIPITSDCIKVLYHYYVPIDDTNECKYRMETGFKIDKCVFVIQYTYNYLFYAVDDIEYAEPDQILYDINFVNIFDAIKYDKLKEHINKDPCIIDGENHGLCHHMFE